MEDPDLLRLRGQQTDGAAKPELRSRLAQDPVDDRLLRVFHALDARHVRTNIVLLPDLSLIAGQCRGTRLRPHDGARTRGCGRVGGGRRQCRRFRRCRRGRGRLSTERTGQACGQDQPPLYPSDDVCCLLPCFVHRDSPVPNGRSHRRPGNDAGGGVYEAPASVHKRDAGVLRQDGGRGTLACRQLASMCPDRAPAADRPRIGRAPLPAAGGQHDGRCCGSAARPPY